MIGHYVNQMTRVEEDRVLTNAMRALCEPTGKIVGPCLLKVAADGHGIRNLAAWDNSGVATYLYVGHRFDALANRFGAPRVGSAIRNRILSNRARRTLQNRPAQQHVVEAVR